MQPSWLSSYHHSAYIVILGLIPTMIYGLTYGTIFGLRGGIIFGAVFGLHGGLGALRVISPVEKIQFSIRALINTKSSQRLLIGMMGMMLGMTFGMILEVIYGTFLALVFGALSGLIFTLIFGLLKVSKVKLTTRIYPNQGIRVFCQKCVYCAYYFSIHRFLHSSIAISFAKSSSTWRSCP